MAPSPRWEDCCRNLSTSQDYLPESYQQDGFVHLTEDPELLLSVANHFYRSSKDPWVLVCLSSHKLTHEVTFQAVCFIRSMQTAYFTVAWAAYRSNTSPQHPLAALVHLSTMRGRSFLTYMVLSTCLP